MEPSLYANDQVWLRLKAEVVQAENEMALAVSAIRRDGGDRIAECVKRVKKARLDLLAREQSLAKLQR